MNVISISHARQNLPELVNRVYKGEEFLIIKNKIPMAHLNPVKKVKKVIKKRIILPEVFGMWKNRKDFKGLSTVEIANKLRETAWKGRYDS